MKAALYARVSSDKQDVDLSISAQLKALRDYAVRNGYEIVKEFVDEAESGKTADRPEFRRMIATARRQPKPFDDLLVWKYGRFARNRQDSMVYKTLLRKHGVRVISINEPLEDTPTGRLMEAMIESLDEFYSANLGQEITRGLRESASRGFYVASHKPYGFRKVKVKDGTKERPTLELAPPEAEVMARNFREVLHGKGLKELAKELEREGIAGPGGRGWTKTTLYKLLTNPAYTGTLVWGRSNAKQLPPVIVKNAWPAIIDHETFDRVQSLLKQRAPSRLHPKRSASHYLLSGIATCGYCGKALIGHDAKGCWFRYYVCGTLLKKGAGTCRARYFNADFLEQAVINRVKENILTDQNLRELVRLVNEEMDAASSETNKQLATVSKEIADVDRRLDRLYDALETGDFERDDLAPRLRQLRERKDKLQATLWELEWQLKARKVELADLETVSRYVADLRELLTHSSLAERKSFIRSFVKEVKVTGNKVELLYTIPMPSHGKSREELPVLSTVPLGGDEGTRTSLIGEVERGIVLWERVA